MNTEKTTVIFRTYPGNTSDVLALFPAIDEGQGMCGCYQHVGQHGMADYKHCLTVTRPAFPSEYKALARELSNIGYNLDIKQRYKRKHK